MSTWPVKKLGDVFETVTGSTPPKRKPEYYGGSIPFVKPPELKGSEIYSATDSLSGLGAEQARILPIESILVSCIGNLGKLGITKVPCASNQQVNAIKPNFNKALPKFIFYQALAPSFVKQLNELSSGTTVPIVNKSKFNSIEICVPPLSEQQRIVAVLDEAFEGIAAATAHAERNLHNAHELFQSVLHSTFSQKADDWVETTLGDGYNVRDGTHDSPKYYPIGHPLITSKNLKRGALNYDKIKFISDNDFMKINERSKVDKGDVLFAMIGTIGNPVVVPSIPDFAIKNVALFKTGKLSGAFLKYYLESNFVINKMKREAKGSTQKFVGLGYLRNFPISLPPLATQKTIVKKLDALSAETRRLETIYTRKLAALVHRSTSSCAFGDFDYWGNGLRSSTDLEAGRGRFSLFHRCSSVVEPAPLPHHALNSGKMTRADCTRTSGSMH